jgi:5-methylcytosine-specific restriction endonuclease McrA
MCTRAEHAKRRQRESLGKRLGLLARRIRARDDFACVYCGATAQSSRTHLHLDHLDPDGPDVATNLVTACRSCNSRRKRTPLPIWCRSMRLTSRQVRRWARRRLPVLGGRRR